MPRMGMASGHRAGVQAQAEQGKRSAWAGSRVREEAASPSPPALCLWASHSPSSVLRQQGCSALGLD